MRHYSLLLLLLLPMLASAQNLQLHYDAATSHHQQRKLITSTLEMYKPDSLGSTFLFVDFNYSPDNSAAQLAYFEIARNISLPHTTLQLQFGYNGGLLVVLPSVGIQITPAWLAGIALPYHHKQLHLGASLLYRYESKPAQSHNLHFTGVWSWNSPKQRITLSGFIDIWTTTNEHQLVILTEPQLWFNLSKHFALGSEFEISRGFLAPDTNWYFYPTLGLKYTW